MAIVLWGIPTCGTVKKARAALEAARIPFVDRDLRKERIGLPMARAVKPALCPATGSLTTGKGAVVPREWADYPLRAVML